MTGEGLDAEFRWRISRALSRACREAPGRDTLVLHPATARLAVFSDQHLGVRDEADDFRACEPAYRAALTHYLGAGHTLIVLGDAQDLWECRPGPVLAAYRDTLALEAEFLRRGRYRRVHGNHDDLWYHPGTMRRYLGPVFGPGLSAHEALRLEFRGDGGLVGEMILVHGHQGTLGSDRLRGLSRIVVRAAVRPLQRLFGWWRTTPAKDAALRGRHNLALHAFADGQCREGRRLVLVAGHTHEPVFASANHLGRLSRQHAELLRRLSETPDGDPGLPALRAAVAAKAAELEDRRRKSGDGRLAEERPCYFNTGCCSYRDGDITGLVVEDGRISLVRWPDDDGNPRPKVLESADLAAEVFARLSSGSR